MKNNISLAQWALVDEFRWGKATALEFPKMAATEFGISGIEWVNTLMGMPTQNHLDQIKLNALQHGVEMVLVMVDDEGDGCASTPEGRKQFAINHRKWIDIAAYLGCQAIRTNCRGEAGMDPLEAIRYATESYQLLLDYARPNNMRVLVENHGGFSNDGEWMVALNESLGDPLFGSYPDWREPMLGFDNVEYVRQVLPFAGGMSYRNQPTEEQTAAMIRMTMEGGYVGWYGIESNGREAIRQGVSLLRKHLGI